MRFTALLLAAAASVTVAQAASAQTAGASNTTTSSTTTQTTTAPAGQAVNPPAASMGTAPPAATAPQATAPGTMAPGSMAPGSMTPGSMAPGSMAPGAPMTPGSTMAPGAAPMAAAGGPFRPITPAPGADIVSVLQASGQFTILLKAVDATGLTPVLKTTPGITVFAPTDTAFSALPPAALDLKDPANLQKLQALLTYHVINAKVPPLKGHSATPVTTVANKPVTLDGLGDQIKVNDATALQPQVTASNGVIYPIDKVLSPDYVPPPAPAAEAAPATDEPATTTTKSTTKKKSSKKK